MRRPVGRYASVVRILTLLRRFEGARYAPTLAQLAREFDVSTRTIRRDVEVLERLGYRVPKWRAWEAA